ncbi:aminoglycoside phosphotransferase [Halobacteriales archaeon QS_1_68_20]|nr:MAG: aminoglycoside phosphotransferase [Halobacteriales archaeon QS_1_68_20]
MGIRRLVRGTIDWPRLELVAREIARRYGRDELRVEFLEADNWLSTPLVVDDEWFVKVVSVQNSWVHAVFTGARNLGAVSAGTEWFFETFDTPLAMAEHEFEATQRMRELGVNAPEPVDAFDVDGLAVVVMEYLPEFRTLDELADEEVAKTAGELFGALRRVHSVGLAHGDLRAENVLLQGGDLYFIDATNVREGRLQAARSYDLASALSALAPRIGTRPAVAAASEHYSGEELVGACDFLHVVSLRPDHDVDTTALRGEIERVAARAT